MHDSVDATIKELFGSSPDLLGDRAKMEKLSKIVQQSFAAQEQLVLRFKKREIGPMFFEGSALAEHKHRLLQIKEVLGDNLFYEIFGEEGDHPELLVDSEQVNQVLEHVDHAH